MTRDELKKLVSKAEQGELTEQEARLIALDLSDSSQLYLRLFALGRSMLPEFIPVFEQYLYHRENLDVASLALEFLFIYHQRTEHLEVVCEFIDGVDWDRDGALKRSGLWRAGQYLHTNFNRDLLEKVIEAFDNSSDTALRDVAHTALLRAAGLDWNDIPIETDELPPEKLRIDIVEKMRARLKQ
ncbi:MAG: hypothetical protein K8F25_08345 [Fimbriimonadaceae bacterium]|nr:hypothetical protein [Alphaproteobacteria bacterium]